ncbi:DUF6966 domain-containing protein [Agrobacterium vitis]|uniref:DUF6966 domain-containing protein n=1 Tax=Agrobacterium vitis TaxID=373 RepID=UPI00087307D7|nr:hypothetical protein [Agrobacterium vitis]
MFHICILSDNQGRISLRFDWLRELRSISLDVGFLNKYRGVICKMELHPDVAEFLHALRDLEHFLADHGEMSWANSIRQAANSVGNSDAYGLLKFSSLFGGMGSLNDLVLHKDGRMLTEENDRLSSLRDRAGRLATRLKNECG